MARPFMKWVWGGAIVICAILPAAAYAHARTPVTEARQFVLE